MVMDGTQLLAMISTSLLPVLAHIKWDLGAYRQRIGLRYGFQSQEEASRPSTWDFEFLSLI